MSCFTLWSLRSTVYVCTIQLYIERHVLHMVTHIRPSLVASYWWRYVVYTTLYCMWVVTFHIHNVFFTPNTTSKLFWLTHYMLLVRAVYCLIYAWHRKSLISPAFLRHYRTYNSHNNATSGTYSSTFYVTTLYIITYCVLCDYYTWYDTLFITDMRLNVCYTYHCMYTDADVLLCAWRHCVLYYDV